MEGAEGLIPAGILMFLFIFLILLMILWTILPFAIFGIKKRLDIQIRQNNRIKELLNDINNNIKSISIQNLEE